MKRAVFSHPNYEVVHNYDFFIGFFRGYGQRYDKSHSVSDYLYCRATLIRRKKLIRDPLNSAIKQVGSKKRDFFSLWKNH